MRSVVLALLLVVLNINVVDGLLQGSDSECDLNSRFISRIVNASLSRLSPDGAILAGLVSNSKSTNAALGLWNTSTNTLTHVWTRSEISFPIKWSPNGAYLAFSSQTTTYVVDRKLSLIGSVQSGGAVAWRSDNIALITMSWNASLCTVWEVTSSTILSSWPCHDTRDGEWSPDQTLIAINQDAFLGFYFPNGTRHCVFLQSTSSMAWSPDSKSILVARTLSLLMYYLDGRSQVIQTHDTMVDKVHWNRDGIWLANGQGTLTMWDPVDFDVILQIPTFNHHIGDIISRREEKGVGMWSCLLVSTNKSESVFWDCNNPLVRNWDIVPTIATAEWLSAEELYYQDYEAVVVVDLSTGDIARRLPFQCDSICVLDSLFYCAQFSGSVSVLDHYGNELFSWPVGKYGELSCVEDQSRKGEGKAGMFYHAGVDANMVQVWSSQGVLLAATTLPPLPPPQSNSNNEPDDDPSISLVTINPVQDVVAVVRWNLLYLWDYRDQSTTIVVLGKTSGEAIGVPPTWFGAQWSPDGLWLAAAEHTVSVSLWDFTDYFASKTARVTPPVFTIVLQDFVDSLSWSLDSSILSMGGTGDVMMFAANLFDHSNFSDSQYTVGIGVGVDPAVQRLVWNAPRTAMCDPMWSPFAAVLLLRQNDFSFKLWVPGPTLLGLSPLLALAHSELSFSFWVGGAALLPDVEHTHGVITARVMIRWLDSSTLQTQCIFMSASPRAPDLGSSRVPPGELVTKDMELLSPGLYSTYLYYPGESQPWVGGLTFIVSCPMMTTPALATVKGGLTYCECFSYLRASVPPVHFLADTRLNITTERQTYETTSLQCEMCPAHGVCDGSQEVVAKPDFWGPIWERQHGESPMLTFEPCAKGACSGNITRCNPLYKGALCGYCETTAVHFGFGGCASCVEAEVWQHVGIVFLELTALASFVAVQTYLATTWVHRHPFESQRSVGILEPDLDHSPDDSDALPVMSQDLDVEEDTVSDGQDDQYQHRNLEEYEEKLRSGDEEELEKAHPEGSEEEKRKLDDSLDGSSVVNPNTDSVNNNNNSNTLATDPLRLRPAENTATSPRSTHVKQAEPTSPQRTRIPPSRPQSRLNSPQPSYHKASPKPPHTHQSNSKPHPSNYRLRPRTISLQPSTKQEKESFKQRTNTGQPPPPRSPKSPQFASSTESSFSIKNADRREMSVSQLSSTQDSTGFVQQHHHLLLNPAVSKQPNNSAAILGVMVSTLQTMALLLSADLNLSRLATIFLSTQAASQGGGLATSASLSCLLRIMGIAPGWLHYSKVLMLLSIPLGSYITSLVLIRTLRNRSSPPSCYSCCASRKSGKWEQLLQVQADDEERDGNRSGRSRHRKPSWWLVSVVVLWATLQSSIATALLQTLACTKLTGFETVENFENGTSTPRGADKAIYRMSSDFTVACYDSTYYSFLALVVIPSCIVLFIIVPLRIFLSLTCEKWKVDAAHMRFLVKSFRRKSWFLVIFYRKLFLSIVVTFTRNPIMVAVCLLLACAIHATIHPSRSGIVNLCETVSLTSLIFIFTAAGLVNINDDTGNVQQLAIIVITLVALCCYIFQIAALLWDRYRPAQRSTSRHRL